MSRFPDNSFERAINDVVVSRIKNLCGNKKRSFSSEASITTDIESRHASTEASLTSGAHSHRSQLFRLAFIANMLFLLGSALEVLVAQGDLERARSVQGFPFSVFLADDDATWQAYQREHKYQEENGDVNAMNRHRNLQTEDFREMGWSELPVEARLALRTLGESNETWVGSISAQLMQPWSSLTSDQKDAAIVLGYNESIWNNGSIIQGSDDSRETSDFSSSSPNAPTGDSIFDAIFTKATARSDSSDYSNMMSDSPDTKNYTDSTSTSPVPTSEIWRGVLWGVLPDDVRAAFETLGYDEELWSSGGAAFTEGLFWHELTTRQQQEAMVLGYTKKSWNKVHGSALKKVTDAPSISTKIPPSKLTMIPPEPAPKLTQTKAPAPTVAVKSTAPAPTKTMPSPVPLEIIQSEAPTEVIKSAAPTKPASTTSPSPSRVTPATTTVPAPTRQVKTKPPTAPPVTNPTSAPEARESELEKDFVGTEEEFISKKEYFDDQELFAVGPISASMPQLLSILFSFCFLLVGILNWIREAKVFHVWMIQGAVSMILSILCQGISAAGSKIFGSLACHCYLLEAAFMLSLRKSICPLAGLQTLSYSLWTADCMFGAGAVVNVALSYWQFFDADAEFHMNLNYGKILSAVLWLLASAIYLLSTAVLSTKKIDQCIERFDSTGSKHRQPSAIASRS